MTAVGTGCALAAFSVWTAAVTVAFYSARMACFENSPTCCRQAYLLLSLACRGTTL